VAAAAIWAWVLLDEQLTALQLVGGALIVAGIVAVRADTSAERGDSAGVLVAAGVEEPERSAPSPT